MSAEAKTSSTNSENPWDFIEKEIQEFQAVVQELEEYSLKSKSILITLHCIHLYSVDNRFSVAVSSNSDKNPNYTNE